MWIKLVVVFTVVVGITMAAALIYGRRQWRQFSESLRSRLNAARVPSKVKVVDFAEIDSLPSPVQRYLRQVLTAGNRRDLATSLTFATNFPISIGLG